MKLNVIGGIYMCGITEKEVIEQQIRYRKLGFETDIADKAYMNENYPEINTDIGMFDNTGFRFFLFVLYIIVLLCFLLRNFAI